MKIHSSQLSNGEDVISSMLLLGDFVMQRSQFYLASKYLRVTESLSATFLVPYVCSFLGSFSGILACGFICIVHLHCVMLAAHELLCRKCLRIWTSANLFVVIS